MRADAAAALLREAPVRGLDEIAGSAPILVLAPHPDDESLGCGGLIATTCARGQETWVAVLTDGAGSHPNSRAWPRARLVAARAREAAIATDLLGLAPDRLLLLGEPDGAAPHTGARLEAVVQRLASLLERRGIGAVFASWDDDPHCDHVSAARIAATACARIGARHISYPVWALTLPGDHEVADIRGRAMRLDIAAHLPAKRRAIAAHATQHAGLIDDDPDGFVLPPAFLDHFDLTTECFIAES